MSEDHEQLRLQVHARVLEASPDPRGRNIAGHTNDEKVAEFCVKDQFRWDPRVAATENSCERTLAFDEFGETFGRLSSSRALRL